MATGRKDEFIADVRAAQATKEGDETQSKVTDIGAKIDEQATGRPGKYFHPLVRFYATIGIAIGAFDSTCGPAFIQNAQYTASALDRLAREDPAMRKLVENLLSRSVWAEFMFAHTPIIVTIARHHVPPTFFERMNTMVSNVTSRTTEPESEAATPLNGSIPQ